MYWWSKVATALTNYINIFVSVCHELPTWVEVGLHVIILWNDLLLIHFLINNLMRFKVTHSIGDSAHCNRRPKSHRLNSRTLKPSRFVKYKICFIVAVSQLCWWRPSDCTTVVWDFLGATDFNVSLRWPSFYVFIGSLLALCQTYWLCHLDFLLLMGRSMNR